MSYQIIFTDSLSHHGIKGQRWGVRRFQNEDGSYKPGAQGRYNDDGKPGVNLTIKKSGKKIKIKESKADDDKKMSTKKKVAIGLGIAGAALATYGAYKYGNFIKDQARKDILDKGEDIAIKYKSEAFAAQTYLYRLRKIGPNDQFYNINRSYKLDRSKYLHDAKWGRKIADMVTKEHARKAEETAKSFKESYKYLKGQGKIDKRIPAALATLGVGSAATAGAAALSSRKNNNSKTVSILSGDSKTGKKVNIKLDDSFKVTDPVSGKKVKLNTLDPETQAAYLKMIMKQ